MKYAITKSYIGAIPYNTNWLFGHPVGVVGHATDNDGDTAQEERTYESGTWQNAFVHGFVDWENILEIADPTKPCWGCGHEGNIRFIQWELCQVSANDPNGKAKFAASYDRWTFALAYSLAVYVKQPPSRAQSNKTGTLWSHQDVTQFLGGTTHTDPIAYLARWGKTWDDVFADVTAHYEAIEKELNPKPMLSPDVANTIINDYLGKDYNLMSDAEKQKRHNLANELRKASGQPIQN